jgi:hypothetical protein
VGTNASYKKLMKIAFQYYYNKEGNEVFQDMIHVELAGACEIRNYIMHLLQHG